MSIRRKTYIKKSSGKAIFSSKMFMSSVRQDKIRAAFNDSANLELVKQLDEYIGDEYIALMKPLKQTEKSVPEKGGTTTKSDNTQQGDNGKQSSSENPSLRDEYTDLKDDMKQESEPQETEVPNSESEEPVQSENQETVENSVKVKAASNILLKPEYEDAVNEIKGLLNANSTTAGVARVQKKDDEVWIYFKDSVNLNNVMDTVIDELTQGYLWMIFNRLARSENAMVFTVMKADTDESLP